MKSFVKLIAAGLVLSSAAEAEDVNVYSYRQPELIKPLTDAFTCLLYTSPSPRD